MHSHSQTNQTHQIYFLLMMLSPSLLHFSKTWRGSLFWPESVCLISEAFPWDPVPSYPIPSFFFFYWYFLSTLEAASTSLPHTELLEGWCALSCLCSYSVFYKSRTQTWFHIWVCLSESIQGSYIQKVIQTMVTALLTLNVNWTK